MMMIMVQRWVKRLLCSKFTDLFSRQVQQGSVVLSRLLSTMIAVSPNGKCRICYSFLVKIAFVFELVTYGEN